MHIEFHPCILQDIGPLGPLPKKLDMSRYLDIHTYVNLLESTTHLFFAYQQRNEDEYPTSQRY